MATKKTDISQIRKYLEGELDSQAMHQLEREAQDDPFLMDAMEGFEISAAEQQVNLTDLDKRLAQRIGESKIRRLIPWKYYAAAASVLIVFTLGYLLWPGRQSEVKQKTAVNMATEHTAVPDTTQPPALKEKNNVVLALPQLAKQQPVIKQATPKMDNADIRTAAPPINRDARVANNAREAIVSNANKSAQTLDDLLKKMPGITVDSNGALTQTGQAVTKVKLNGKEYNGADVKQSVTNLPADVVEHMQAIDNYGDKATRVALNRNTKSNSGLAKATKIDTIYESGYSTYKVDSAKGTLAVLLSKVPKLQTNPDGTIGKKQYDYTKFGKSDSNHVLKEISIPGLAKLEQKDISDKTAAAPQTLKGKVKGADVNTPKKVSGTILSDLGLPLPGVTVVLTGTDKETQTDANGHFSLPTNGQASVDVKSIGYQSKRVQAKGDEDLSIKLKEDTKALSEVVVTGISKKAIKQAHPQIGWDSYHKYLKSKAIGATTGTIKVSFTVGAKGQLSDFYIIKGLSDEATNQKAIDLVKNGPAWAPDVSGQPKTVKLKIAFVK